MLKINIFCVGNLKEKYLKEASTEYEKRISKYVKISLHEVKEAKIESYANPLLIKKTLNEEGDKILKLINNKDHVILLDLHGQELTSEELATKIENISLNNSVISFVIGGTLGVSESLIRRSNFRLKLSSLTFTHQLTRIILLEQIYRSFKIINKESYHH